MRVRKTSLYISGRSSALLSLYQKHRGVKSTVQALREIVALHLHDGAKLDPMDSIKFSAQVVKSGARRITRGVAETAYLTLSQGRDDWLHNALDSLSESRSARASKIISLELSPPQNWNIKRRSNGDDPQCLAQN